MSVDADHRLGEANWQPSPNWDDRPFWALLDLIVIHCVSLPEGQFGTGFPQALFLSQLDHNAHPSFADLEGVEVAPHLFIDRLGKVTQFVSFDKRAWHAGISKWGCRSQCNDFSIGIELEGAIACAYTLAQFDALIRTLTALLQRYDGLCSGNIVGHSQIAPDRKQDPGTFFDWRGLYTALQKSLTEDKFNGRA